MKNPPHINAVSTENDRNKGWREPGRNDHLARANGSSQFSQNKIDSVIQWVIRCSKRADNYVNGIQEQAFQGPKIYETMMGRLRFLQGGGIERFLRHNFHFGEEEKLLKTCSCYIFTTAGPIAGSLFISTEKLGFCSYRSLTFASPDGLGKTLYKISVPLRKISNCFQSKNINKPKEKYLQIITVDDYEFWFKGFANYQKAFKNLQRAISLKNHSLDS